MGFKTVYEVLLELFPKVDSRLLKAVSIEHSKDADAAAEVVVSEILPYVSRIRPNAYPVHEECNPADPLDEEDVDEEETSGLRHRRSDPKKSVGSSSEPTSEAKEDGSDTEANSAHLTDSTCQEKAFNHSEVSQQANVESEELILLGKSPRWETDNKKVCPITELEVPVSLGTDQNINFNSGHDLIYQDAESCLILENNVSSGSLADQVESDLDDDVSDMENPVVEQTPDAAECDLGSQFSGSSMNDSHQVMSKQDKIDFLDEIVEAAKNNKKTLFSAMESAMNMMREVEIREKAAEVAQEEAARGGLDILVKVEELKQMLAHAREANDMHAGEVYGEKAILATEVKELQARLFSLSEERDRALSILDEMHHTLEARLTAADELRKSAEQEKMEKEESAQKLLSEQEAIMEKVVQESEILQQEAEENSKLREFLMDRGRIVDSLQGEISVICQDVRLLKEKFDERVPLSKSISSSQTSCILASSGSSLKSMAPDLVPELGVATKSPTKTSPASSMSGQSPESRTSSVHGQSPRSLIEEERRDDNRKELLDDGWDFFENEMEMSSWSI